MSFARLTVLLLFVSLAQSFIALAQTNVPDPLPPAAQEAMEKGLIAAKQQEYLLAIRLFQDARKIAPAAPILFFNLGLAESKIPGRELRAMTWFGAYLAASPNAANVAAVKQQINELDVKNQASLSHLIQTAQDAAKQFGDPASFDRNNSLSKVAELWAKSGDFETATQTADAMNHFKSLARLRIATAQAEAGDIAGAQKTADSIQDIHEEGLAQADIAKAQAKAGDIASALKTANEIQDADGKSWAQGDIAKAQAKAGDIASALKTANEIKDADGKSRALFNIAWEQAIAKDIAGAKKTADSIQDIERKGWAQESIVDWQLEVGDIAGAQKTVDSIQDASHKKSAQKTVNKAQAKTKAGASTEPMFEVYKWISENDWLLNEPFFLNLSSYLKSLPSEDPEKIFNGLHHAAEKIADARQVITRMLKQQAQPSSKP